MSASRTPPSEVSFASFFVYSPREVPGEGAAGPNSRRLVRSIKNETEKASERWNLAAYVRNNLSQSIRDRYFGPDVVLIPVPGHAPPRDEDSRWPARELCKELVKAGLGCRWEPLLRRAHRVNKAALSPPDARPTPQQHFLSLECAAEIGTGRTFTVVDDVITRGATMLAAIAVIKSAHHHATVQGFALVRTMSDIALQSVVDPVEGKITLHDRETRRRP